jgi:PAS domain-containing protein
MDGDEAGVKACRRLKERLKEFAVSIKTLPDSHDPNSYLMEYGPQKLAQFIQTGNRDQTEMLHQEPPEASQILQSDGFVIACGVRQYRVMSLDKGPSKLRATIRVEHAGKLHIDSFDLYTARARTKFAADLCGKFEEMPETIEADITRIIRECENMTDDPSKQGQQKPVAPAITDKDKKAAQALGKSKDLIKIILNDFQTCGLIGEEANKLLGYIAMTSRKQNEPLSVQILSSSGSGKTALQDAVVNFCPPEDLVKLTSLSGKALFYKDRMSLKHKVLALEEGDGAGDASYAIRSLISSGVLINETTIKDLSTGRLTTMENRVEGPTAVFYTTTNPDVDPETKSRFFVTGIDESREQTRRILAFQRESHLDDDISQSLKAQAVIKKHHAFQRLLKPLGVKNPYSGRLAYGDDRLQGRRDQPKYLNLIKSVAFLRQMQKQILSSGTSCAYIEADPEDIRIANQLAAEILGRSLDELSRPGRDLLILLDEMIEKLWKQIRMQHKDTKVKRTDISFTRRDIREYTGWSNYRVHTHMKELVNLEYVFVETGKNGSCFRYRLAYEGQGKDGSRFILGLTDPEALKN